MSIQQTLIIVKPDGMAKGLVGEILRSIKNHGLRVVDHAYDKLDRQWVERLYENERDEVYFIDVVMWVSSSLSLLLKVEGENAVSKVKWHIIGRFPDGIRGAYAENWIKNVAHAPDSPQSAIRELNLAEEIFIRRTQMKKIQLKGKKIFALTGMSESGKSTVGKYLDSKGIRRLKIVKLFEKVRDSWLAGEDLYEFIKKQESRDPYALWDAFIDALLKEMEHLGVNSASIESLYGGGLGPYLKQKLGEHFCLVFVDIPQETRLKRQMERENLTNIEEAKKILLPRDEIKDASGIPALKDIADEVIDNSGTQDDLKRAIDDVIKKHLL